MSTARGLFSPDKGSSSDAYVRTFWHIYFRIASTRGRGVNFSRLFADVFYGRPDNSFSTLTRRSKKFVCVSYLTSCHEKASGAIFWSNPHPLIELSNFQVFGLALWTYFQLQLFAVCSRPPSTEIVVKAAYPRMQQRRQKRRKLKQRSCNHGCRNGALTLLATLSTLRCLLV